MAARAPAATEAAQYPSQPASSRAPAAVDIAPAAPGRQRSPGALLEIFAGSASLSAAALQCGAKAVSVDYTQNRQKTKMFITMHDLRLEDAVDWTLQMLGCPTGSVQHTILQKNLHNLKNKFKCRNICKTMLKLSRIVSFYK